MSIGKQNKSPAQQQQHLLRPKIPISIIIISCFYYRVCNFKYLPRQVITTCRQIRITGFKSQDKTPLVTLLTLSHTIQSHLSNQTSQRMVAVVVVLGWQIDGCCCRCVVARGANIVQQIYAAKSRAESKREVIVRRMWNTGTHMNQRNNGQLHLNCETVETLISQLSFPLWSQFQCQLKLSFNSIRPVSTRWHVLRSSSSSSSSFSSGYCGWLWWTACRV